MVKGAVIFPAAAALAWAVLAYVCIDFGFWHKLFAVGGEADRVSRAVAEAVLAATLLVFLFAYLNLNRWHVRYSPYRARAGCVFLAALVGFALFDAPVAAGRRAHHAGDGGGASASSWSSTCRRTATTGP